MTPCKRCGRPLKDPKSVQLGMGKICAQKALGEVSVKKGYSANFSYEIKDGFISIIDLNGAKSVTNDMENVIHSIETDNNIDATKYKIIYRDSLGVWDGLIYHNKNSVSFYSIGASNPLDAQNIVLSNRQYALF